MSEILIIDDPFSIFPEGWEVHRDVNDIEKFLLTRFPVWPQSAKIYNRFISQSHDITPIDEIGAERLRNSEGPLIVVVYPQGIELIIAIVALAAVVVAAFLFKPSIPTPSLKNRDAKSSNNELSGRQNEVRLGGRIPDIFGTVRSVPDLLSVPFTRFENNIEIEDVLMCIGKGEYQITGVPLDGTTRVIDIQGMSVEVWRPDTAPWSSHSGIADTPQYLWGSRITDPMRYVQRVSSINGQTLRPPNERAFRGNVQFRYPNIIALPDGDQTDFQGLYDSGDILRIDHGVWGAPAPSTSSCNITLHEMSGGNAVIDLGIAAPGSYAVGQNCVIDPGVWFYNYDMTYDLAGTYEIAAVGTNSITLLTPDVVNPAWSQLGAQIEGFSTYATITLPTGAPTANVNGYYSVQSVSAHTIYLLDPGQINSTWNNSGLFPSSTVSALLSSSGPRWIGPFTIDYEDLDTVASNFVALNGLYKDDGTNQYPENVNVILELTPVDVNGNPTGSAETFNITIFGSGNDQDLKAATLVADPTFTGRCRVRACRSSPTDTIFGGTVVDEVKWRDVYGCLTQQQTTGSTLGDITIIRAKTLATTGALNVKERKLNLLATRKVAHWNGSSFDAIAPTNRVDDIMFHVILDDHIGRMENSQIDFANIVSTIASVEDYFGTAHAVEFSYTFDQSNISFEETLASIASTVFCNAYRRGYQIRLTFEKETNDSVLLFNCRNKVPKTEIRTTNFGYKDGYDGVEIDYVDPIDDAIMTYYVPGTEADTVNRMKIETVGIRTKIQAYFHAWRAWNKIRYQNTNLEFEGTQEADLLLLQDRILVEDNTRLDVQDGEVIGQSGLALILSQDITLETSHSYTIYIQHVDGTVEARPISGTGGNIGNPSFEIDSDLNGWADGWGNYAGGFDTATLSTDHYGEGSYSQSLYTTGGVNTPRIHKISGRFFVRANTVVIMRCAIKAPVGQTIRVDAKGYEGDYGEFMYEIWTPTSYEIAADGNWQQISRTLMPNVDCYITPLIGLSGVPAADINVLFDDIIIDLPDFHNRVVLDQAPRLPLSTDYENFARCVYSIVDNATNPLATRAFIVSEKAPKTNATMTVRGYNYDSRYYGKDLDVVNDTVDEENPF